MDWLRSHPYMAAVAGTVILIIIGAIIVGKRAAVEPGASSLRAWGGVGANLLDTSSGAQYEASPDQENLYTEVRSGPPFYYAPGAQVLQTQSGGAEDLDLDELLASLSHAPKDKSTSGSTVVDAYSFIPTGFLSTSTTQTWRTPTQLALYNYANEAASNIQSYEDLYRNAPQIMKSQFEDRQDPDKNAALLGLANSLAGVGNALLAMEEVPSQVLSAHEKLGASYREMGEKLSRIPAAKYEQDLIEAVLAYNAVAETYTKNYIALVTLFSAYGVTFKSEDPGSVFTFTNTSLYPVARSPKLCD